MPSAGDVPVLEHVLWFLPVQYFSLPTANIQKTELGTEWDGFVGGGIGQIICFFNTLKLLNNIHRFNNAENKLYQCALSRTQSIYLPPSQHIF